MGRRRICSRWTGSALAATAGLLLTTLTGPLPPATAVDQVTAGEARTLLQARWTGSLRIEEDLAWTSPFPTLDTWVASATYTSLQPSAIEQLEADGSGAYTADHVEASFRSEHFQDCGDGQGMERNYTLHWEHSGSPGPSGDDPNWGNGGHVVRLDDRDGGTYLLPHFAAFAATANGFCPGSHQGIPFGADALSYHPGHTVDADTPLVDDDPDPDRLVGTTTYGLQTIPGGRVHDYRKYHWTVTYDLTRELVPFQCSDSVDNDGDGLTDATGGDPGCTGADDQSERGDTACDNGLDDDHDGHVDYQAAGAGDPHCYSAFDPSELEPCSPTGRTASQAFRTVTTLPAAPNVHWYTTTGTASLCTRGDQTLINGLDVTRHAEAGPVPFLLGKLGLSTGTETDVTYAPPPDVLAEGVTQATARLAYTACFDLTKLLDKLGAKDYLKKKLRGPVKSAITGIFDRAGLNQLRRHQRRKVLEAWSNKVDHAFRKGVISSELRRRYDIPAPIARLMERAAGTQSTKVKVFLKRDVRQAAEQGRLDGYTARKLADKMIDLGWKAVAEAVAFCGGTTASRSVLLTWDTDLTVTVDGDTATFSRVDRYLHPVMTVQTD